MVESKSDDTAMHFKAHSELSCFVRPLAVLMFFPCSEWKRARRLKTTFEELLSICRWASNVDPLIESPISHLPYQWFS